LPPHLFTTILFPLQRLRLRRTRFPPASKLAGIQREFNDNGEKEIS
jgi:hypothetical protein